MSTQRDYEGEELDLFEAARRWKGYWSSRILPHIGQEVLEVGAGFGVNTPYLFGAGRKRWMCLEPDPKLVARIPDQLRNYPWFPLVETKLGTLTDLPVGLTFDTLLYIDVLEHIEDDHREMKAAFARLKPKGNVIVLSPAHQSLYTEFDRSIGHYRRYSKSTLLACTPPGSRLVDIFYLDSLGLLASMANRLALRQSMPSSKQIDFWDRYLVSNSRWVDPILGYNLGKTVVSIWSRD